MPTKINVRSPFYIKANNSSLASATMQLYIYTGVLGTNKPASPQYTITKNEIDNNNYVVFEISELVRDYLDIEFDGEYDSQTVWVESDITMYNAADGGGSSVGTSNTDYIALDGYGYFTDSINPELQRDALRSNLIIYKDENEDVILPVFAEDTNTVKYYQDATLRHTVTISDNGNTNQKIQLKL